MVCILGKMFMFQDVASKQWYPATITSLCAQPRSYNISTKDGITYRKTQAHLKPYQPKYKNTEDEHSDSDKWTLKANCKQFDNNKSKNNQVQHVLDQRETLSLQLNLICDVLSGL